MFCICNEKFVFNKYDYYLPRKFSMNYKRYSIENIHIVNEIILEIINQINTIIKIEKVKLYDNYFEYKEKELNEDYVSIGYFKSFVNLGKYLNTFS